MTIPCIKQWFKLAVPETTDKNRAVQLGCHFEEVAEMLAAIGETFIAERLALIATQYKKDSEVEINEPGLDRIELLDALCDQIVTAVGVAHMFSMDIEGALAEVTRSNYSKFVDGKPMFDTNGKIAKPPSYSKPNLEQFV